MAKTSEFKRQSTVCPVLTSTDIYWYHCFTPFCPWLLVLQCMGRYEQVWKGNKGLPFKYGYCKRLMSVMTLLIEIEMSCPL